MYKAVKNSI